MGEQPKITQEMIQAFDEYTHITLDRRGFMDKLTKLAGSGAAAAAIAPMLICNYAKAQVVPVDDKRIKTEDVSFAGPAGQLKGYLVTPAGATGKLPTVLVIHENRGLNPHIRDVTRRMGTEGFIALGIDLMSRVGGTPPDDEAAGKLFGTLDRAGLVPDGLAAVEYLRKLPAGNGKVGAVGFCFGGSMVNNLAVADPRLNAGVPYYGGQPTAEEAARIKTPLLLQYAELDTRITAGFPAYEEALKKAGTEVQGYVYPGTNHGFNNDASAARFDKAASDLAWSRTVAFFKKHLA